MSWLLQVWYELTTKLNPRHGYKWNTTLRKKCTIFVGVWFNERLWKSDRQHSLKCGNVRLFLCWHFVSRIWQKIQGSSFSTHFLRATSTCILDSILQSNKRETRLSCFIGYLILIMPIVLLAISNSCTIKFHKNFPCLNVT